ncbi:uncharacterized protein LOC143023492 [Oratosquilla oratoria]|uniref:uncharacterized protein LOC143023492 n=1 Tax=Oratosquilla oratoria TaxID=337810 RepID=UPI003F763186
MSCGNYRGISLLSIVGKTFARVLLDRLLKLAEKVIPEFQCGFRPQRGTVDMICARQLQEKSRKQQEPLMCIFGTCVRHSTKFLNGQCWGVLARFGCPPHFISLVRAFHEGMMGRVLNQGAISEPFAITGGLNYRLDGRLFKLSRLRSTTNTSIISARELHYVDDNATLNRSSEHLQQTTDLYVHAY